MGRNLAVMQLHLIIASLFRRYDFSVKPDTPVSPDELLFHHIIERRRVPARGSRRFRAETS